MAVTPQNWTEAGLDSATLADSAPLLAVWSALEERYTASLAKVPPRVTPSASGFYAPRPGESVRAESMLAVAVAIRNMQAQFVNPAAPYASDGYSSWPDFEKSTFSDGNGLCPWDAANIAVQPQGPVVGDTATSAGFRAFLQWARESIDRMTLVDIGVSVGGDGWVADESSGDLKTVEELLDAAVHGYTLPGMSAEFLRKRGSWHGVDAWMSYMSPGSITCENRTPLAAQAVPFFISPWPVGEMSDGGYVGFWAGGIVSDPGPGTTVSIASHSSEVVVAAPGKVEPPAPTEYDYTDWGCSIKCALDFSGSFRFFDRL